jgi:hypothetical protein
VIEGWQMEDTEAKKPEVMVEEETLKPPYGNIAWYETFFEKIRSRDFDKFDKEIIELNIIKGPNAMMLFRGLRFLGLVEKDGKTTEKFKSLRRFGDDLKQNLNKVVKDAYGLLFSKVVIESAKPDTLLSFFAEYYGYGEFTAEQARKIFIYLCKQSDIVLSKELTEPEIKVEKIKKEKKETGSKEAKHEISKTTEGMHKIEWGDTILIYLKQSEDKNERERLANQAKKLIDMYYEG